MDSLDWLEKVLKSPADYTNGEIALVKWLCNMQGSFFSSLFDAIQKADPENLANLEKGFPEEVEAFKKWRDEKLFICE